MRALIVFESMFGNTEQIADAVCEGLSRYADTRIVEVVAAPERLAGVDLVVAGGPTHAFGMTRPRTRADATKQATGGVVSGDVGLREWLASLPKAQPRQLAATFDSRIDKVRRLPGSAARGAAKRSRSGQRQLLEEAVARVCSASARMSRSTGRPIALTIGPAANQYR